MGHWGLWEGVCEKPWEYMELSLRERGDFPRPPWHHHVISLLRSKEQ